MTKNFIPTKTQRLENKRIERQILDRRNSKESIRMDINSKRKIRFGAIFSFTTPRKEQKTKSFTVHLDTPLTWEVIVTKVTKALKETQKNEEKNL